eukprot:CAMPEP_0167795692 /NCGR_PEP_ID=MMETSP0111_2-20121227/14593_1 /TAXON_ID=91324 /ORGANISM="Lotharella globosa, Strain CCCM811" /LENGTH=120 /DNA_ID=CAMNT_0007689421 /DNA_START=201 /DNA_END=560 /DNA_ORIENTATION=+
MREEELRQCCLALPLLLLHHLLFPHKQSQPSFEDLLRAEKESTKDQPSFEELMRAEKAKRRGEQEKKQEKMNSHHHHQQQQHQHRGKDGAEEENDMSVEELLRLEVKRAQGNTPPEGLKL